MNEKFHYRVTIRSHCVQAWPILMHSSILLIYPLFFCYFFGLESVGFAVKFSIVWFSLVFFPHLILHVRYWYVSKGVTICFDVEKKRILFARDGVLTEFSVRQILRVDTTLSKAKVNGSPRWYPWDSYFFSVIHLQSGESLLVTSLLVPELSWPFELPREKITGAFICWS